MSSGQVRNEASESPLKAPAITNSVSDSAALQPATEVIISNTILGTNSAEMKILTGYWVENERKTRGPHYTNGIHDRRSNLHKALKSFRMFVQVM